MSEPARVDLRGRVCLVTGATSGIGKETARALAGMNATVVLAARDEAKGERVRDEIVRETGNHDIHVMPVDLASQASIHAFANDFKQKYAKLHVLVNNAGLHTSRRELTPDGIERTLAVNHLGPFLLTSLLLDRLKESAPSRIVTVASEAHRGAWLALDDLQGETWWSGIGAYNRSKLANIMFTYALARRLEGTGVTANCLHPGVVRTAWGRGSESGIFRLGVWLATPIMMTPTQGARTSVHLAASPDLETVSGKYFVRSKPRRSSRISYDEAAQERLWEESEALTGGPASRR